MVIKIHKQTTKAPLGRQNQVLCTAIKQRNLEATRKNQDFFPIPRNHAPKKIKKKKRER